VKPIIQMLSKSALGVATALLLTSLLGCATHHDYPISGLQLKPYPSQLEAVIAASNRYNPVSLREDREFMGLILQRDGQFYYTVAASKIGQGNISIALPSNFYGDVVAFWHTHGKPAPEHHYFSPRDTALVRRFNLPFYLADDTGFLKVFTPDHTTLSSPITRRLGFANTNGIGQGEKVKTNQGELIAINTEGQEADEATNGLGNILSN